MILIGRSALNPAKTSTDNDIVASSTLSLILVMKNCCIDDRNSVGFRLKIQGIPL